MIEAAAAGLALLYGVLWCWREGESWPRSLVKTGALALLAISGAVMGAPSLIVSGLAFGALGDFCLSRPGTRFFLAGMAAFAIGHLAYAWFFVGNGGWPDAALPLIGMLGLVVLAASTEFWLAPHTGSLRWPVRGYVVVITLMGIAALMLKEPLVLFGAALFVLSDLLLSLNLFVVKAPRLRLILAPALWAAYWLGQLLILHGALAVISAG